MYCVPPAVLQRRVISAKLYCFGEINKKNVNFPSFFTSKNVKKHPKITLFENQTYYKKITANFFLKKLTVIDEKIFGN